MMRSKRRNGRDGVRFFGLFFSSLCVVTSAIKGTATAEM